MKYADATAFRQALEERLRSRAPTGADTARDRKRVVFDRFLLRLTITAPGHWVLKGGFALDLRLAERARTTRDIDLDWQAASEELLDTLLDAAATDADDYFSFQIERSGTPPNQLGGSYRFRVTAALAGRTFDTFALDVGVRSDSITDPETIMTSDLLAFAEIDPVSVPTMPLELQVAEKLHAYTRRYQDSRPSTRVKDLLDLALIASLFALDATRLREAIATTFDSRAEHDPPKELPAPPTEWAVAFRELAAPVELSTDLNDGHAAAAALLDPVLGSTSLTGIWSPENRAWQPEL